MMSCSQRVHAFLAASASAADMLMPHAQQCSYSTSKSCMHVSGGLVQQQTFSCTMQASVCIALRKAACTLAGASPSRSWQPLLTLTGSVEHSLSIQSSVISIYSRTYSPSIDCSCPFHARSAGEVGKESHLARRISSPWHTPGRLSTSAAVVTHLAAELSG